ncbi:MAG: rod shape-determining protein MreC [Desulfurella sp.]|uniref:rod shape-determining protein MreC n=1 Tax=Desulfurella sp. TaxID=1962857 RepID=UPI003C8B4E43
MKKLLAYAILAAILSLINYYTNFSFFVSKGVLYVINPIESSGYYALDSITSIAKNYIALQNTQQENSKLKSEVVKLTLENKLLMAKIRNLNVESNPHLLKCPFVFKDFSDLNYIYIKSNSPTKDMLHKTVVSQKLNLVGTVESKVGNLYKVKTVFNTNFVVDCFIINNDKYYRGILKGSLKDPKIEFLNTQSIIKKGDQVITSGLLGNMTPNINIGTIGNVFEVQGFYKTALVIIDKTFLDDSFVYVVN